MKPLALLTAKRISLRLATFVVGIAIILTPLAYISLLYPNLAQADPGTLSFSGFSPNTKTAGVPFLLTIKASDNSFSDSVQLSDTTGTISPTQTGDFVNGIWTGNVVITKATASTAITAMFDIAHQATTSTFSVQANQASAQLSLISGNGQNAIVNTQLTNDFVVRTVDPFGNILSGINVAFSIQSYPTGSSGTLLSATSDTTAGDGYGNTKLKLGTKIGSYAVQASVNNGASSVTFFANATPAALSNMKIVPSAAVMIQSSIQQFSLTATDGFGNPINLSSVSWRVVNGGGSVDSSGLFSSGTALGSYANTVEATVGSIKAAATVTVMSSTNFNQSGNSGGSNDPEDERNVGLLSHVVITPNELASPTNSQQLLTAQAYDVFNNALATISYNWEATGDIGTLATGYGPTSLLKTAAVPGSGSIQVTAIQGEKRVTAQATVSVQAGQGGNIVFNDIASPQKTGTPFTISVTVKDAANNTIDGTPTPIVLSDSTGTITPRVITDLSAGVWTGEVTINSGDEKVVILATSSGFAGSSNVFKVEGESQVIGSARGGNQVLSFVDNNKLAFAVVAGLGILGSAMALGILGSRGLQAVGRNPLARKQIFLNLYLNAGIAILVGFISVALALMLKNL